MDKNEIIFEVAQSHDGWFAVNVICIIVGVILLFLASAKAESALYDDNREKVVAILFFAGLGLFVAGIISSVILGVVNGGGPQFDEILVKEYDIYLDQYIDRESGSEAASRFIGIRDGEELLCDKFELEDDMVKVVCK